MTIFFRTVALTGLLAGACVTMTASAPASAAPIAIVHAATLAPSALEMVVRRRRVPRNNVGPAVVLGLFGALAGSVIANQRYNNYNNYSYNAYGYPNDYGYGPGYYRNGYGYRRGW